jgi:hypothetical protein
MIVLMLGSSSVNHNEPATQNAPVTMTVWGAPIRFAGALVFRHERLNDRIAGGRALHQA